MIVRWGLDLLPETCAEVDVSSPLLVSSGRCGRWVTIAGEDPQTGAAQSKSMCVDDWKPTLLIDVARKMGGVQAATESFRNCLLEASGALSPNKLALASSIKLVDGSHG